MRIKEQETRLNLHEHHDDDDDDDLLPALIILYFRLLHIYPTLLVKLLTVLPSERVIGFVKIETHCVCV